MNACLKREGHHSVTCQHTGDLHCSYYLKMYWLNEAKKKSLVSGLRARHLRPARRHFEISLFCYETMSNCSQNCWIDWPNVSFEQCINQSKHIAKWTVDISLYPSYLPTLLTTIYTFFQKFFRNLYNTINCMSNLDNNELKISYFLPSTCSWICLQNKPG